MFDAFCLLELLDVEGGERLLGTNPLPEATIEHVARREVLRSLLHAAWGSGWTRRGDAW